MTGVQTCALPIFDNFLATLTHESATSKTYASVNTGSMSASHLANDADLEGLSGVAANAGMRAIKGHGITSNAFATIRDLARYGLGEQGQRLRSELAAGLTEVGPQTLSSLIRQASRAGAYQRTVGKINGRIVPRAGTIGALAGARGAGIIAGGQ